MSKKEIVIRLCMLTTKVMNKKYNYTEPADCFCDASVLNSSFNFSPEVLKFIEEAVDEKLEKETV